jgi:hypothetical protein
MRGCIRRYGAASRLAVPRLSVLRSSAPFRAPGQGLRAAMVKRTHSDASVEVHPGGGSPLIQRYMDERFQHMYASPQFLSVFRRIPKTAQHYIAWDQGKVSMALIFQIAGKEVLVVNEQIALEKEELEQFVQHVFRENPSAQRVIFPAISQESGMPSHPYSAILRTSDIVLSLPTTAQAYLASLGKSTRSALKRYINKVKRDYPSFKFEAIPSGQVNAADIDAILAMNEARIEKRNQAPDIGEKEAVHTRELLDKCGFVALIKIDNQIVAGSVNYQFGDNFFLHLLSHDSRYDHYGLGTMCCYLSICECIARGGKEYHFLWGQYEYKYRLLGVQRDFVRLTVYRSAFRMLLQSGLYVKPALANTSYLFKDWVIRKSLRKDKAKVASIVLYHAFNAARNLRRSAAAGWGWRAASRNTSLLERQQRDVVFHNRQGD